MHILHQCIIVMIYDDADYIRLIYTVNVTFKIWQNSFMVDRLPILYINRSDRNICVLPFFNLEL
jgi:hypothetical protein